MRRFLSITLATALEILSEPLTLLVLLSALAIAVLAPAFHYHQFGEATRMARDAGFSSLLTCGAVIAVFGTIRTIRREVETGTMEMALAHPISRTVFFAAKTAGSLAAYLVFALIVFLVSLTIVEGAAIGGEIALRTGDVARLWGPCFAFGVGTMIVPLVVGAALNRFACFRFVLTAIGVAVLLAMLSAGFAVVHDAERTLRLVPVAVLIFLLTMVLLTAAAAFSVRLKAHVAAAMTGGILLLLLPAVGNYYLSDALSSGGIVSWNYVGLAGLAALPPVSLFAALGIHLVNGRDIT